jgi:metal-responsive CopG/Arc/MetJ family transcriptional regulator
MPEELPRSLDAAATRRSASRRELIRKLVQTELEAENLAKPREGGIDDIRAVRACAGIARAVTRPSSALRAGHAGPARPGGC